MQRRHLIIVLALALFLLSGCATNNKPLTTGDFDGQTYSNDYFGLTFTVPEEWSVAGKEELANAFNVNLDLLGDISADKEKVELLKKEKVLPLAYVSRYAHGTSLEKNYNFSLIAQNIKASNIQVEKNMEYIDISAKQVVDKNLPVEITMKEDVKINGVDYAMMEGTTKYGDAILKQRLYCTIKDGYVLSFTITFITDEQLAELNTIINSINIK